MSTIQFTVFTKPWKTQALPELAAHLRTIGFAGVELPVRPGFQVQPASVARDLPAAAKLMADAGVPIRSIAGPTDEATLAACQAAGVPIIRVCEDLADGESYAAAEARLRRKYDALVPLLAKHGVTLGVQNHCDRCIGSAIGLLRLIEPYDPRHLAAVLDPAHCALDGEPEDLAVDIAFPRLCMVNLKNAIWQRTNPDAPPPTVADWRHYWTAGRDGLCSWPLVAAELKRRDYRGIVCLTAEYSDHAAVERLIAEDLSFARELLG